MVELLPVGDQAAIVEFGGGTGPVTQAMLASGFPPEQLYVFELSDQLSDHLRRRFPKVNIIHASAAEITSLACPVGGIISSLPLRSLPETTVREILEASANKLQAGGCFVQFTYDLMHYHPLFDTNFHHLSKKVVWANLPPARIDIFRKRAGAD
ncbi:phospholipid methyltransferase [Mariprofundus erugo]|uniref:Phospholipid methyltransferase n=1 Tax=Mariprofundus erugo TaxID=2528639 RepID=A0A5R9GU43_9PROT|nr:phospholipid methyltransferase [Mariprofundus erugo]TLS67933.1 phospholipid methyltransferase [Mariprofundus erugo]TLS76697.1 phospholipid methyltransferase [Mariprofundus erugo]